MVRSSQDFAGSLPSGRSPVEIAVETDEREPQPIGESEPAGIVEIQVEPDRMIEDDAQVGHWNRCDMNAPGIDNVGQELL